ncbi:hypothetical protein DFH07DRAFT_807078 [Mycena maculata]|uniref:DUF6534 domain-containing protein n=1 Tax=Mycena maculata TaxID=230809 RepID=A0AAD7NP20_9AGAR|nr:hypothetical protein DFH07DRAFT_807078 [Mycena maculata]
MDPNIAGVPPGFEVVQLSGPLFVAYLIAWGLFTVLTVQLYLYYQAFPNDRLVTKSLVYTVYILELVQIILNVRDGILTFGYGFADIAALTKVYFVWFAPMATALVAFIAQSFYAYRIYVFSKSPILPYLILTISLGGSVSALIAGVFTLEASDLTMLKSQRFSTVIGVWNGASALSDVIIAVSMTYYLSIHHTGFRQTHVLISNLIRLTIETGSLTALVAVIGLIIFFAFPGRVYYLIPAAFNPGLYANTLLVLLNSRFRILGGRSGDLSSTDMLSIPSFRHNNGTVSGSHLIYPGHGPIVSVNKEVFSDVERDGQLEMKAVHVRPSPLSSERVSCDDGVHAG